MGTRGATGFLGLVFLVAGAAGLPGVDEMHGLFSIGLPVAMACLLAGVVLLAATAFAGGVRPWLAACATLYGAFALSGLNRAVGANWPEIFGRDGRALALALALLLALAALSLREVRKSREEASREAARPTPWMADNPPPVFISLERPPSPAETADMLAKGVRFFDFDLDLPPAEGSIKDTIAAIKAAGAKIGAYHIGCGGGSTWGEPIFDLTDKAQLERFKSEVARLVAKGADFVHIDNMDRLKTADQVGAVVDAARQAGAVAIDKNVPRHWADLLDKRPELKPPYALIENAVLDEDQTDGIRRLATKHGVPVYIVDFERTIGGGKGPTPKQSRAYADRHPWISGIFLIPNEKWFEGRHAMFIAPAPAPKAAPAPQPQPQPRPEPAVEPAAEPTARPALDPAPAPLARPAAEPPRDAPRGSVPTVNPAKEV